MSKRSADPSGGKAGGIGLGLVAGLMLAGFLFASDALATVAVDVSWNELETSGTLPMSRKGHEAIYDSQTDRMIIFGGWSSVPYNSINDTWAFDLTSNTWTQLSTTGGPPATRAGFVAIYDGSRHRMVIFAGSNWWTTQYNDTWSLDLDTNTWTKLSTTGGPPAKRFYHCGVYDIQRDRLIIFGGTAHSNTYFGDTWALDLNSNTWTQLTTTGGPPALRCRARAIWDDKNDRMLIFGGANGSGPFSDVWALNLATSEWSYITDYEDTVDRHESVFAPEHQWMISMGGWYLNNHDQVAIFNTNDNSWIDRNVYGDIPSTRDTPKAIFDPIRNRVLMFGGGANLSNTFNDTWELLLPPPSVCDPSIDIILNDAELTPGETLTVTAHVTNDDNPDKVEVKVWIELPDGSLKSIHNIPSYNIPAGVDMTVPLFNHTFTGSEPAGAYQFGGRFLNIINGDIFCEDAEPFTFTP